MITLAQVHIASHSSNVNITVKSAVAYLCCKLISERVLPEWKISCKNAILPVAFRPQILGIFV